METMKITKELKVLIEKNQNQLKTGIRNHQRLLAILESDPENTDVQKQLQTEQEHIIVIGLEQKVILDKLRREYKIFRKQTKINGTKSSIDDKRFNLTIALHRAKKQTIIQRATPANPISSSFIPPPVHITPSPHTRPRHRTSPPTLIPEHFDSQNALPAPTTYAHLTPIQTTIHPNSAEPIFPNATVNVEETPCERPLLPQDVGQVEFLQYLQLATHDVFKEMQSKRVERKRRSTANPQFLYTRGWDISKRKRNFYLSNLTASAPTTRQSVRSKVAKLGQVGGGRVSPPNSLTNARGTVSGDLECRSGSASPTEMGTPITRGVTLPGITHLPSGLTIEPVREEQTICIDCKQPGNLSICEECSHAFHVACHNRPLVSTPRHCPVCYTDAKEARLRQQIAQHSGSPITIVPPSISSQQQLIEEKLELKTSLLNRNKQLTSQLTELQDQHSQLTISLRTQEQACEDLMSDQDCTKDKIHKILAFISKIQSGVDKSVDGVEGDVEKTNPSGGLDVIKLDGIENDGLLGEDNDGGIEEVEESAGFGGLVVDLVKNSDGEEENVNSKNAGFDKMVDLQGGIDKNAILTKFSAENGNRPKVVVIQQNL